MQDLAHQAWGIDRSVGVPLPCDMVVSAREDGGSTVAIRTAEANN